MTIIPQDAGGKNHRQRISSQGQMNATSINKDNITALILAGGAGRRVGGVDKGLLDYKGTSLIERVMKLIEPQVGSVLISSNRNTEIYSALAPTIAQDIRTDFQGPLAGIEAAMSKIGTEFLLLTPCDVPNLPEDLAQRLASPLISNPRLEISFARSAGQDHFLCALLRTRCLQTLPEFLDSGQRRVRDWFAQSCSVGVDWENGDDAFSNINELSHMDRDLRA